jgi:hypothetical protein
MFGRNTRPEEAPRYRKKSLGQVWAVNARHDKLGRSRQGSTILVWQRPERLNDCSWGWDRVIKARRGSKEMCRNVSEMWKDSKAGRLRWSKMDELLYSRRRFFKDGSVER